MPLVQYIPVCIYIYIYIYIKIEMKIIECSNRKTNIFVGGGKGVNIDQFHEDVTVTSLAAARALWWQKHTVTSGVKREKSTE